MSNQRTILVTDDDAFVRSWLKDILREADPEANIIEAANGDEAIAQVERANPSLLLLDLVMPGKSGLDTLRAVHASHPALPIVVVSSMDVQSMVVEALEHGATSFVGKPFDPEEIASAVSAALGGA